MIKCFVCVYVLLKVIVTVPSCCFRIKTNIKCKDLELHCAFFFYYCIEMFTLCRSEISLSYLFCAVLLFLSHLRRVYSFTSGLFKKRN